MSKISPGKLNRIKDLIRLSYRHYHMAVIFLKVICDAMAIIGAVFLAATVLDIFNLFLFIHTLFADGLILAVWISLTGIVIFKLTGLYHQEISFLNFEETRRVINALFIIFLVISPAFILLQGSAETIMIFYFLATIFVFAFLLVMLERTVFYKLAKFNFQHDRYVKRVAIYDACSLGSLILKKLAEAPQLGCKPVGFIDNKLPQGEIIATNSEETKVQVPVLGPMDELLKLVKQYNIEEIFIAAPAIQTGEMKQLIKNCQFAGVDYRFVPNLLDEPLHHAVMYTVGNIPFIKTEEPSIDFLTKVLKRSIDIVLSLIVLIVLSPFFLLIAILIKKDSQGPIIFKQTRIGKNGQPFTIYKFRTMHVDSPQYNYSPTSFDDKRITRIGGFLRKTSLDELPQFFNVLKNDMSVVGPRPEMPFIVEQYNDVQRERLLVKPGITGLWQITLDRSKLIHENLDYDFYYIKHMSVLLDLLIIFKTIWFAVRGVSTH